MWVVFWVMWVGLQIIILLCAIIYFFVNRKKIKIKSLFWLFILFLSISVLIRLLDIGMLFSGSVWFDLLDKYMQFFILLAYVRSFSSLIALITWFILVVTFIWNKIKK